MLTAVLTAEEHGGLSADVQEHYTEAEDGSYRLEISSKDGWEFADTRKLKSALQKERIAGKKAADGFKALTETVGDLDVEAARAAVEKLKDFENWDPEKKLAEARKQFEEQLTAKTEGERKKLIAKHAEETKAMNAMLSSTQAQLRSQLIAREAVAAINAAGGSVELLVPIVERATVMKLGENGHYHAEVVDATGVARLSTKSGSTDPMSVAELVEELKGDEKFARAFDGTGAKGSGSSRSASSGGAGSSSGAMTIRKGDHKAIAANLEGIAKGKVKVK